MRLGVKVHWRDVDAMAALARRHGATVLEYQMLPGDFERHRERAFDAFLPYRGEFELRVHQPDAYEHEGRLRRLDPASPDEDERARSTALAGEMMRHAMEMRAKAFILHPGGVAREPAGWGSPDALAESLGDLPRHVRVLLENMPWFNACESMDERDGLSAPWTTTPEGLARFADQVDGFVLDLSHAFLARDEGDEAHVRAFARTLGPRILHVHANGSRARIAHQGEGTPFSDSDYGAPLVRDVLARISPNAVVVPEIKDGHRHGGARFDAGLAFLRAAMRADGA